MRLLMPILEKTACKLGELGVMPPYHTISIDIDNIPRIMCYTDAYGQVLEPQGWGVYSIEPNTPNEPNKLELHG